MDMMDILRRFIKAERMGNWDLHLHTVREMLPYFLAAGHTLSAYVYLNNMLELESQHPDVHTSFKLGKHVIRRSDRYWAGLSSDLVIEQVLMRSVKTTGGLTSGRMFESATPTVEELVTAGEQAIVCVHGGNIGENLDDLQYKCFIEKVASSAGYIQGNNLPPTSAAAHYHSLRSNSEKDPRKLSKTTAMFRRWLTSQHQPICCWSSVVTARKTAIRCDVIAERMYLSTLLCVVYAKEAPAKIQLPSLWKLSMTTVIEGDIYR